VYGYPAQSVNLATPSRNLRRVNTRGQDVLASLAMPAHCGRRLPVYECFEADRRPTDRNCTG
jgi:hypothetical protein